MALFHFPVTKLTSLIPRCETEATRIMINLNLSGQLYKIRQLQHDVHHLQKEIKVGCVYIVARAAWQIDLRCADHTLPPLKIQNRTGIAGFQQDASNIEHRRCMLSEIDRHHLAVKLVS